MLTREAWDKLTPDEQWKAYRAAQPAQRLAEWDWTDGDTVPSGKLVSLNHIFNPVDDQGNPPPANICGDMWPVWYDGKWWTCNDDYVKRRREKGDQP